MLPTEHPVFRHFWYPLLPSSQLEIGEVKATKLLDEPVALFRTESGVFAVKDRCSHRSAKLSAGEVKGDCLQCPYHGWTFDGAGKCVDIPQVAAERLTAKNNVAGYRCTERYGYVWVALEKPLIEIPTFGEEQDEAMRRVPCFFERWETSAFRTMENELDMAHFSYVHTGTFGNQNKVIPRKLELTDLGRWSLHLEAELATVAPPEQAANTGMAEGESSRTMNITWFMPFIMRLDMTYESGLRHVIINCSTPIEGAAVQVVQFHYRSDDEATVPASQLIEFESKIVAEDRAVLEVTDPSVNLDDFQEEAHMPTDRAGLMMRKKLRNLIRRYDQRGLKGAIPTPLQLTVPLQLRS